MARYEKHTEYVHQPVCEAGDGAWLCSLSLCVATCPALLISCVRTDGHVAGWL